jgi:autotransporter-associated beta strand protein
MSILPARSTTAALLFFLAGKTNIAFASTTWTGSGGNVNWSTAGNWSNGAPTSFLTTEVVFSGTNNIGSAGSPLTQNIGNPMSLYLLTFASGAGNFYVGGSDLRIEASSGAGIVQSSANAVTISNNLAAVSGNAVATVNFSGDGSGLATFSGIINKGTQSRDYKIVKAGTSSFALTAANTYAGGTTINGGAIFANNSSGSGSGAGTVTVNNSGSTFGGSGIITGSVSVGASANLSPGSTGVGSTAILRTGAVTLSTGANFNVDLNSTTVGTGYDQLKVTGSVNLGGALASNLVVTAGSGLTIGQKFFVLLNDGSDLVSGTFAQGTSVTASNGDVFTINYLDNGDIGTVGNDISLTFTSVTAVPEPRTFLPGLLGLVAISSGLVRRVRV